MKVKLALNVSLATVLLISIFALAVNVSCSSSKEGKSEETPVIDFESSKVAVIYFHGKQRCFTCVTLQNITQATINEFYGENPDVAFYEIDYSDRNNDEIAEKYEIAMSSLIIATKDKHINLTMDAFNMVNSDPNELKELIITETNNLLNL